LSQKAYKKIFNAKSFVQQIMEKNRAIRQSNEKIKKTIRRREKIKDIMIRSREIEIPEIGEYHARIILVSDGIPAKNQMNIRISLIDQTKKKERKKKIKVYPQTKHYVSVILDC